VLCGSEFYVHKSCPFPGFLAAIAVWHWATTQSRSMGTAWNVFRNEKYCLFSLWVNITALCSCSFYCFCFLLTFYFLCQKLLMCHRNISRACYF